MSIITASHNLLQLSLPSLHAARLNALMVAVGTGLTGGPHCQLRYWDGYCRVMRLLIIKSIV
jgi:hypothetical protein